MLEHCEKRIESLEAKFGTGGEDAASREASFTGKCFVVLAKQADMHKVCDSQDQSILRWLYRHSCAACGSAESTWEWSRAPEPSDISWENMQIGVCSRAGRGCASFLVTTALVGVAFVIIGFIKESQK